MTPKAFEEIAKSTGSLQVLILAQGLRLSPAVMRTFIQKNPRLRILVVESPRGFSNRSSRDMGKGLFNLEIFSCGLSKGQMSGAGLVALVGECPNLQHLEVNVHQKSDGILKSARRVELIQSLPLRMRSLHFTNLDVADDREVDWWAQNHQSLHCVTLTCCGDWVDLDENNQHSGLMGYTVQRRPHLRCYKERFWQGPWFRDIQDAALKRILTEQIPSGERLADFTVLQLTAKNLE